MLTELLQSKRTGTSCAYTSVCICMCNENVHVRVYMRVHVHVRASVSMTQLSSMLRWIRFLLLTCVKMWGVARACRVTTHLRYVMTDQSVMVR